MNLDAPLPGDYMGLVWLMKMNLMLTPPLIWGDES